MFYISTCLRCYILINVFTWLNYSFWKSIKAIAVHKMFNCMTNVIEDSFPNAKHITSCEPSGMQLYGLPVSLKESIGIRVCYTFFDFLAKVKNELRPFGFRQTICKRNKNHLFIYSNEFRAMILPLDSHYF